MPLIFLWALMFTLGINSSSIHDNWNLQTVNVCVLEGFPLETGNHRLVAELYKNSLIAAVQAVQECQEAKEVLWLAVQEPKNYHFTLSHGVTFTAREVY